MKADRIFKGITMLRICLFVSAIVLSLPAHAATSLYSDLHGKTCRTVDTDPGSGATTRRCAGVAGYSLLVHEARAQASIDIVTPRGQVFPLQYWDVVTPGLSRVGRKAEWRMENRNGKPVPTGLLVRLDLASDQMQGPRQAPGAVIAAARIASDGACVVYHGDGAARTADEAARKALAARGSKCLGVFTAAD